MKTALCLLTFASLISCQTTVNLPIDPIGGPGHPPGDIGRPGGIDARKPDTFLGRPLTDGQAACRAAGLRCRVVEVDGKSIPVTMDYLPDRLNFKVRRGIIIAVTRG